MSLFSIEIKELNIGVPTNDFLKLQQEVKGIMATLKEVQDQLDAVNAKIAAEKQEVADKVAALNEQIKALQDQVKALQDQIAAGSIVTAADLDALVTKITDIGTGVEAINV